MINVSECLRYTPIVLIGWLFLSFAAVLNYALWQLNPQVLG